MDQTGAIGGRLTCQDYTARVFDEQVSSSLLQRQLPRTSDERRQATVTAHAPGGDGPLSDVARNLTEATGATCVAVIMPDPAGNGSYSVAGPLEAQFPMSDVLEKVADALRTQLMGSVQ